MRLWALGSNGSRWMDYRDQDFWLARSTYRAAYRATSTLHLNGRLQYNNTAPVTLADK